MVEVSSFQVFMHILLDSLIFVSASLLLPIYIGNVNEANFSFKANSGALLF